MAYSVIIVLHEIELSFISDDVPILFELGFAGPLPPTGRERTQGCRGGPADKDDGLAREGPVEQRRLVLTPRAR